MGLIRFTLSSYALTTLGFVLCSVPSAYSLDDGPLPDSPHAASRTSSGVTLSPASEEERQANAKHVSRTLYKGNGENVGRDQYIIVDLTGSTTRSGCPYGCEDRNLPKEHCKTWTSKQDASQCYVQDTRLKSSAMP